MYVQHELKSGEPFAQLGSMRKVPEMAWSRVLVAPWLIGRVKLADTSIKMNPLTIVPSVVGVARGSIGRSRSNGYINRTNYSFNLYAIYRINHLLN